jgi:hypothetical protein
VKNALKGVVVIANIENYVEAVEDEPGQLQETIWLKILLALSIRPMRTRN